jgi:hypothetical protein
MQATKSNNLGIVQFPPLSFEEQCVVLNAMRNAVERYIKENENLEGDDDYWRVKARETVRVYHKFGGTEPFTQFTHSS